MSDFDPVAAAQDAVKAWIADNRARVSGMSELDQYAAYIQDATKGKGLLGHHRAVGPDPAEGQGRKPEAGFSSDWHRITNFWRGRGLSVRSAHILATAGCASLDDLRQRDATWVGLREGAGPKTVKEISKIAGWPQERKPIASGPVPINLNREAQIDRAVPIVMSEVPLSEDGARRVVKVVLDVMMAAGD